MRTVLMLLACCCCGNTFIKTVSARSWLPKVGLQRVGSSASQLSSCFEDRNFGGSAIVQCGGPTVTQLASRQGQEENIREYIAIQDHSILLIDHTDGIREWPGTNPKTSRVTSWGMSGGGEVAGDGSGEGGGFQVTAYSRSVGFEPMGIIDPPPPRSIMGLGYTTYKMDGPRNLQQQQFLISSPSTVSYYLSGCPTYPLYETEFTHCPEKSVDHTDFKFTVLGLLSGATINSLNTDVPPTNASNLRNEPTFDVDIANYKTLLYRTTLDIGGLGTGSEAWISGGVHDGKTFADITPDDDLADTILHVKGSRSGEIQLSFEDTYYVGTYSRSYTDLKEAFTPNWNESRMECEGDDDDDDDDANACTKDVTGFEGPTNSLLEGTSTAEKLGSTGMSQDTIKQLGGAPYLQVSAVETMKITMQPSTCTGRPEMPFGEDVYGTTNAGWPDAPADCPWWIKATEMGNNGVNTWRVDKGMHDPRCGDSNICDRGTNQDTLVLSDLIDCEPGSCYTIDFHITLGGMTEDSRTLFGNPKNSPLYGWENGVFFMYDPSITGSGGDRYDWSSVLLFLRTITVILSVCGCVIFFCFCWGGLRSPGSVCV